MIATTEDVNPPKSAELQRKYEASDEFKSYLAARQAWITHKENFTRTTDWYVREKELFQAMRKALHVCRATPIHREAFGW